MGGSCTVLRSHPELPVTRHTVHGQLGTSERLIFKRDSKVFLPNVSRWKRPRFGSLAAAHTPQQYHVWLEMLKGQGTAPRCPRPSYPIPFESQSGLNLSSPVQKADAMVTHRPTLALLWLLASSAFGAPTFELNLDDLEVGFSSRGPLR